MEALEDKLEHLGFSNNEREEYYESHSSSDSFMSLIQRFKDKGTGKIYEAVITGHGLKCNCKEWESRRCCKHTVYIFDKLSVRDEHGRVIGFSSKVTEMPTYQEASVMDFGRNNEEAEKWHTQHIAVIEL